MLRRPVCAVEDLPPGTMKLVQAGKFGVGVYNIDGSLYAIANYCSHEGAPLCLGYTRGNTEYDPEMPDQIRHVREGCRATGRNQRTHRAPRDDRAHRADPIARAGCVRSRARSPLVPGPT